MRILFVAPRFHTNQAPFAAALVEAGHDVVYDVLSTGSSEDHDVLRPNVMPLAPVPRLRLRMASPDNLVSFYAAHGHPGIRWYLQRYRVLAPDVVVVRDPNRPFGWRAALAARLSGLRVMLYTQGPVHERPDPRKRWKVDAVIRALDAVWFSPVPGDLAMPGVHPDLHYLPFAADLDRSEKRHWFSGDEIHLLDIGKFVPRKNHELLLRAFQRLSSRYAVRLTIAGEVSTEEHRRSHARLLAAVSHMGLEDRVTVRTNVGFRDVAELYRAHDLFVLPSRDEPASVSILEAMTHGLPVVCSSTSGTRWYLPPQATGFVFRSDDLEDLTTTLDAALSDRAALVAMGRAARRHVEEAHDPARIAAAFLDLVHRWRGPDA